MRATVIPAAELSADLASRWSELLALNPRFQSPLLQPELYRIIGKHRPKVCIAVGTLEGGDAFFPFERGARLSSFAAPVPLCDYQAVITAPANQFAIRDFLRAAGLQTWNFDHLLAETWLAEQVIFVNSRLSRQVTMPQGFDVYVSEGGVDRKQMRNVRSRLKQLTRDFGEPAFQLDDPDPGVLGQILRWKADRFKDDGGASPPVSAILEELLATKGPSLQGVVSTLRTGDSLVAAHFGVKSGSTLFHWFPAFNPDFSKYGPGALLLVLMLENLHVIGCDRLDFGPGGEQYKSHFANSDVVVGAGFVELPSLINLGRATWRSIHTAVRTNTVSRALLRPVARALRTARR